MLIVFRMEISDVDCVSAEDPERIALRQEVLHEDQFRTKDFKCTLRSFKRFWR